MEQSSNRKHLPAKEQCKGSEKEQVDERDLAGWNTPDGWNLHALTLDAHSFCQLVERPASWSSCLWPWAARC
eukprot:CAMPEP_0115865462 /NCGR_PEP_ID=MMETSP0287-20121206/19733_1 /TAXON_ID=412157 /ORGANISM="Chrysochromulina rotalis, Strain UIO044" /LENGTH=71 /DNA_ID=CAMNT_0003319973 /DNA_START=409 /DNA_END=624 /DNA_ORIENTATION=+